MGVRVLSVLVVAQIVGLPSGCTNYCPPRTELKRTWIALTPMECRFTETLIGTVISYTAPCGDPHFESVLACKPLTPEAPK